MIQLLAAVLLVVLGSGGIVFVGLAAKKPYDSFDLWATAIFAGLIIMGIGRTMWLAFNAE